MTSIIGFEEIYSRNHLRIRRYVAVVVKDDFLADDLTQETFCKAKERLDELRDRSKAGGWLMRIAHNLCMDHYRKIKRRPEEETKGVENILHLSSYIPDSTHKALERNRMSACVQDQLLHLPVDRRAVLVLYDLLGFKQKEIAPILGISVANVKVRLHRARNQLKSILNKNCTFERDERDVFVCIPRRK